MNVNVLKQFLREDGDTHVRRKLLEAIQIQKESGTPAMRKFTFNRFNVSINLETRLVTVEDDLTSGPEGECVLKLEDFQEALLLNLARQP